MEDKVPYKVVQAWQEAVNHQDAERLLQLSDPNIEIVGPRSSGWGHELLRDWLARAGLSLETRRIFARDEVVVVAQQGVWRSVETGEVVGEQPLASRFRVVNGCITQFARYDSLETALAETRLGKEDEVIL